MPSERQSLRDPATITMTMRTERKMTSKYFVEEFEVGDLQSFVEFDLLKLNHPLELTFESKTNLITVDCAFLVEIQKPTLYLVLK